jgi:hypothetical protein
MCSFSAQQMPLTSSYRFFDMFTSYTEPRGIGRSLVSTLIIPGNVIKKAKIRNINQPTKKRSYLLIFGIVVRSTVLLTVVSWYCTV